MSEDHSHKSTNARALTLALVLTGAFLIAEVVGGILTGSLALISDAAHMMTDTIGLAIALAAIKIAQRPADSRRTFGYERFEILAAAFNALLLFGVAAYILREGYQRLARPQDIQSLPMLAIAVLGLVVNLVSMRMLADRSTSSVNVKGAYLEVWSDFLGSLGVIVAAALIWLTGWKWIDPLIAVGIGLWVLPRAWTLLKETLNVLLEGVPEGLDLEEIATALASVRGVTGVHDLHVWALSSDSPSLSAHLVTSSDASNDFIRLATAEMLAARFKITHVTLQTEAIDCRDGRDGHGLH